jgi:signal transduction histidine kinase
LGRAVEGADVTARGAARLAWSLTLLCVVMLAVSLVLLYLNRSALDSASSSDMSDMLASLTLGSLGGLVASRRPENAIGWIFLTIAVTVGISALADHVAVRALLGGVSPQGWPRWPAWLHNWIGNVGLGALVLVLLLYPDGKPLSPRWRWVAWFSVGVSIAFCAVFILDNSPIRVSSRLPALPSPIHVPSFVDLSGILFLSICSLLVAGLVSLVLRLRRSFGDERQQIKWFVYATGVSIGVLALAFALSYVSLPLSDAAFTVAFTVGFTIAVPAAAGLAILRYGLYEIDVVINKTLVYFFLAAVVTAIYVAIVVGIGAIIGARGNTGLSILATAVVAVAFQPIRDRSRIFANRLVYGKRSTPYEVLSEFADKMAATYSVEEVLPQTARILGEATGAVRADVWLMVKGELQSAGFWPTGPERTVIGVSDVEAPDIPGATRVVAVRHQAEVLGALSVEKPPGDALTPAEDKLLTDVAAQAGLVLRNVRLIEDLRASRQRLVTAQDEERRKIERNIHDGAQQQLVALAIKTRLATSLVGQDETKAREVLTQMHTEAQDALENLRELARGIYPPLLADQGLGVALRSQVSRVPVPVTVEADGIARYGEDAEAAIYFSVLEGLQNVAKYAEASEAVVRLSQSDGAIEFEIADDGRGFDSKRISYGTGLQGIADRLAALGGTFDVESEPGVGTTIHGTLPVELGEGATETPESVDDASFAETAKGRLA